MSGTAAAVRLPRYTSACITQLLGDAAAPLCGREPRILPLPDGVHGVVVLVVDGLGRHLLDAHADVAPVLASAPGTTIDAVFPATTTANLTSLATGVPPAVHGMAGTVLVVDGRRLAALTWTWDRLFEGPDARADVVPERLQSTSTLFERLRGDGLRVATVLRPEFIGSGLTRAALRGGEEVAVAGLEPTLRTAVSIAGSDATPTLVYAHHGQVDTAGHLDGPASSRWCEELAQVDAVVSRAVETLPAGVALVVTADHGMVAVDQGALVELTDRPDLLEGVEVLGGDARAPMLYTRPGATPDVLATWRESFAGTAEVHSREDALAAGWFGPPEVGGRVPTTIGDVVVTALDDGGWVHRDLDTLGGRMPGHHGAMTAAEIEIPALVLTG